MPRILAGLDALLARDGFASVAEAVGTGGRGSRVSDSHRGPLAFLSEFVVY